MTERIAIVATPTQDGLVDEQLDRLNAGAGHQAAIFGALAHRPALLRAWARLGNQLGEGDSLPTVQRELMILRVAALNTCSYVWDQHHSAATTQGITALQIATIRDVAAQFDPAMFPEEQRILIDVVNELFTDHAIGQRTWASLSAGRPSGELVELLMVVGYYSGICLVANALELASGIAE